MPAIRLASCGAPSRAPVALGSTGPLISPALPSCTWEVQSVSLVEGDRLLLYTDGVSDALESGNHSGDERIRAAVRGSILPEGRRCSTRSSRTCSKD